MPGALDLGGLGFGKQQRLLKASDFNRVFKQGRRVSVPEFTVAFRVRPAREGQEFPPRLGLSVSRKVGGAVQRNLIKRRLREIFRLEQFSLVSGAEIVVIPRKEASVLGYSELKTKVLSLWERGKLVQKA
jgi:ribonuclease P protein component